MAKRKKAASSATEVKPEWVMMPPTAVPTALPIETRQQVLPFGDLTWKNFERLCFRLAGRDADAEHWELYGRQGQAQQGIDIYVRRGGAQRYACWQAKRYARFTAGKVKDAVDIFLAGKWADKTDTLVLCVQADLQDTKIQDAIEVQAARLAECRITFIPHGGAKLSEILKDHPDIVDDFFGRVWVEAFCGKEAAARLGRRLDGADVIRLRQELHVHYASYFSAIDPGLIVASSVPAEGIKPPGFLERFVIPDVLVSSTPVTLSADRSDDSGLDPHEYDGGTIPSKTQHDQGPKLITPMSLRRSLATWIAEGECAVIIGEAGSGKSTILRALALDLLSDQKLFPEAVPMWGTHIPVVLPFAFWTRLIVIGEREVSLADAVRIWFQKFNVSEELLDLLARTLEDRRLLLLVDGLDEWVDEAAARSVFTLLDTFVKTKGISAVATGRPHGVTKLGGIDPTWRTGRLAAFSVDQQRQLVRIWLGHPSMTATDAPAQHGDTTLKQYIDWRIETFFGDLAKGGQLASLAGTPLLLSGLISLAVRRVALPRSRFRAYDELIVLLLEEHPKKRSKAALDSTERFRVLHDVTLRKRALACLAYHNRSAGNDNGCARSEARRVLAQFLQAPDEAGLSPDRAIEGANELLAIDAETSGLLLEKAPGEVGFVHGIFEETLAGDHLSGFPMQEQMSIVRTHGGDPRWRNVILGLLHTMNRAKEVDELVREVLAQQGNHPDDVMRRLLAAEVAFGDFRCTPGLAAEVCEVVFERIETGNWMPEREALLSLALEGASTGLNRERVLEKLPQWFPEVVTYKQNVYAALGEWPQSGEVERCLWLGLFDEEHDSRRSAAHALAKLYRDDLNVGNRLCDLACAPVEAETAAAALEALNLGWPDLEGLDRLVDAGRRSANPALRVAAIRSAIDRNRQDDADLDALLYLARFSWRIHYYGKPELIDALVRGWGNSQQVIDACLSSLGDGYPRDEIDHDIARAFLLNAASARPTVDQAVADLIRRHEHFLPYEFMGGWGRTLAFPQAIRCALDERLQQADSKLVDQVARVAVAARTEGAKHKLIAMMDDNHQWLFWSIWGLLEGWGMGDPEVAAALSPLASHPPEQSQYFAHLLPKIVSDKARCRALLLQIAQLANVERLDFLIQGFANLGIDNTDHEVLDALLVHDYTESSLFDAADDLITTFAGDPRVADLARRRLNAPEAPLAAIARAYRADADMRALVLERLRSLPPGLRTEIAAHAARRCDDGDAMFQRLAAYRLEDNANVRTAAAIGFHDALRRHSIDLDDPTQRLLAEVKAIGPQMDEVRSSALAGLIALGRLDAFRDLSEPPKGEKVKVPAFSNYPENQTLLAYLSRNWGVVRNTLGAETFVRLSRWSGDEREAWKFLSPYVGESSILREDFLAYCRDTPDPLPSQILEALGRLMPRSSALANHCLRALADPGQRNDNPFDNENREIVIGRILGRQFAGDDALGRELEQRYRQKPTAAIIGLALGWPESPVLANIYAEWTSKTRGSGKIELDGVTSLHLCLAKGDTDQFHRVLDKVVNRGIGFIWEFLGACVAPVFQRLEMDDALARKLFERLGNNPSASEKASYPRLLTAARGLDADLRAWCEAQYKAQCNPDALAEVGLDVVAGRLRPVAHALLDILVPLPHLTGNG